jgi:hypothetical protein
MRTVTMPVNVGTAERSVTRSRPVRRRFYVGIAVFMTAIVVAGFWRSYFWPLFHGNVERPWVIQLHGLVFVGWMALLLAQVGLVSRGRTRLHRKLGTFGIVCGCLVLVMGLVVSFAAPLLHLAAGEWDMDLWLSPLLVGMGYDWITRRRVHPAYVIGTVGLLIGSAQVLFMESESWLRIGRPY